MRDEWLTLAVSPAAKAVRAALIAMCPATAGGRDRAARRRGNGHHDAYVKRPRTGRWWRTASRTALEPAARPLAAGQIAHSILIGLPRGSPPALNVAAARPPPIVEQSLADFAGATADGRQPRPASPRASQASGWRATASTLFGSRRHELAAGSAGQERATSNRSRKQRRPLMCFPP